jgi:nucleoid DNA-binding protein
MNISEFVDKIYKEFGFSKAESRRIFDFFLKTVVDELRQGREIKIRNFGTFRRHESLDGKCSPKFYASRNFFKSE